MINKRVFGGSMIIAGLVIIGTVAYLNSRVREVRRPYSTYTLLTSSWEKYKRLFINKDGRVLDSSQNDITTSEGQSYALLRAVMVDDKETFDTSWQWTKDNLRRDTDNLFGWRWGKRNDGKYDFLENGGENSASDADSDIALALVFAGRRWQDQKYIDEAKMILTDIWKMETGEVNNTRYLTAGNWASNDKEIIINPSYFAPYAWRIFAQIDQERDWQKIIKPAYDILDQSGTVPLDKKKGVGLPPDWLLIDKTNGEIKAVPNNSLTTNYSFDAMRIPWRVALDYQWNRDDRARDYLEKSYRVLAEYYKTTGKLPSSFSHDGSVLIDNENPAMYATALGYFLVTDSELAKKIYEDKIIKLYSNDSNTFRENIPYYEQNWLWFGAALYQKQLLSFDSQ